MELSTHRRNATAKSRTQRAGDWALTLVALVLASVCTTALAVPAGASGTSKVVITTSTNSKFGKILVSNGKALYTLVPSGTACGSQCLVIWPAVSLGSKVSHATAGHGVSQSALGVTNGPGGIRQVTYHGHPVYWYAGDTKGQVNGNKTDEWGKWTVVVVGKHTANSGTSGGSTAGSGGASF